MSTSALHDDAKALKVLQCCLQKVATEVAAELKAMHSGKEDCKHRLHACLKPASAYWLKISPEQRIDHQQKGRITSDVDLHMACGVFFPAHLMDLHISQLNADVATVFRLVPLQQKQVLSSAAVSRGMHIAYELSCIKGECHGNMAQTITDFGGLTAICALNRRSFKKAPDANITTGVKVEVQQVGV